MAKQSIKQQIYESIANSQVQQVMAQKREQELAALQADFSGFMQQQQNPEALMADFNSFMQSQQPKSQPVQTQKIPSLSDHQKLVNKAVEERTRLAALDKKKAEEQKAKEENRAIVSGISQRLQDSVLPKEKKEEKKIQKTSQMEDYQRQQQEENVLASAKKANSDVEKWLSPDYKLTDEERKAAKEYAQAELQKLNYDSNKKSILKSAEDRQHYSDMVNLLNKSNTLTNAMTGVIKQPAALGRAVRDAGRSLTNQITGLGAALGDKLGITEGATQRHNENVADRDAFYRQNDESMQRALEGAHTQNPIATGAGEVGGQLAMYALTNPMFDALGAAAGLGKAGSFALNQVGQNAQDLALDTIPMLNNYLEGGVSDEERKELLKNVGINAAGNLAMGAVGEGIGALARNRAAKKAADEAFRANAMEGADKLAKLAGTEDIDNIVRSATRQTEEAAQNIEDISKQIPKVPEEPKNYIPSMEELRELEREASVMDEAEDLSNIWKSDVDTKGLRPHTTNQGVSPSIENAAEELSKQMDAPKYSVDNGVDNPNLTREANDDWVRQDIENPNRFVSSAEPDTKVKEHLGGKVVAEDTGMSPGTYKLQTFADGDAPKERWNTSAFRDNTVEKQGWGDKLDRKDYGYRVYSEAEQNADAAAENLSAIELIEKDQFTPSDVKQAMKREAELYEMGDEESIRKAQRLGTKIAFETREAGRIPQALAEFDRTTPQGQLRFAQNAIDDIVDKKVGTGTSEALDNIVEKINKAYDKHGTNKEAFAKEVEDILNKDITNYVNGKTAKKMQPRTIKGKNKILKMIANGAKIEDISDVIYKQNGGVKLTAQENKQIYDLLQSAQKLPEGSYEQEELLARAAKIAVAKAPSTLGQKIRSVLYTNMLGNFKTALSRNAFGNFAYQTLEQSRSPIAALVDRATSLATKKRSTLGWNGAKFKAYGQGFKKGAAEQISDMTKGISTGRSGAKGWEVALANNATTFNDTKAAGKLANDVEYYVRSSMALGDRPWYEANYAQRSTELHQLIDKYGKENVVGLSGIKDEDLDDVIDMIASVHAADSVFQKHGKMSKGLTDIRNGLGQMSEGVLGVDVLSTAASPFTMTPGNMLERAIEYTPLGFVKNAFETGKEIIGKKGFNQRRFVDEASRTITGLPVLYGAYKLAQKGGINGGYSTDQDEKQAQIDDGYIEYGLNLPESIPLLGGKTLDTSDLPVYGPFMQAGSVIAEQGLTPQASLQAAEAVLGGSTTQGLRRAFGGDSSSYSSQDSIVENLKNTVLSSGSQLIPSLARQTAQTIDPYKRDLGEYGTLGYYWNLMRNSDPVGRQQLPIKYDVEGNPVLQNQGRSLGSKILENYFLPMNMSEYEQSPLNQEASRLLESADTAMAFVPKAARKDLRGWDEKAQKEYTEEQFRQYKQDLGTLNSKAGHALIESDFYQGLSDAQKAKTLSEVYSAMKQIAKENATGLPSDDKIAAAYKEGDIDGMLNYIAGKTAVKETGYKSNSKVGQAIQAAADSGDTEAAMDMSSQVELLPNYGLDKPGPAGAYTKAYGVYDGLSAEEFAKTYKAIDKDHNQGLTKAEIIDYMNVKGYNQKDGMDFWKAYAKTEGKSAWKIPKLENNTWK